MKPARHTISMRCLSSIACNARSKSCAILAELRVFDDVGGNARRVRHKKPARIGAV